MKKLIFISVGIFFFLSVNCGTSGQSPIISTKTAYGKLGPYTLKTIDFPDLKNPKYDNCLTPLKVIFPVEGKNFPLVVVSHGAMGTRHSYDIQAEHLASHGYVIFSVEDIYSNTETTKRHMREIRGFRKLIKAVDRVTKDPRSIFGRPKGVSFAIDMAQKWNKGHKALSGKINTDKIAVMGHSYGAYTTLVVCGAQPILDHLDPPVPPGKGLAGDLSDPRVTFGFAMSPQSPGSVFFNADSYKTINRPLICLVGSKDSQKSSRGESMAAETRMEVFDLLPPGEKYFLWLNNVDHLSFTYNPVPTLARKDLQRIIKAMLVISCDHFLKGKKEAQRYLSKEYLDSLTGRVVNKIRWYRK